MLFFPFEYDEPVFRPPSEAYSLILQVTFGCSWNKCAFCEMYSTKRFKVRDFADIQREIQVVAALDNSIQKVFLADGNAAVLSTDKLLKILQMLNESFPLLRRISAYALPKDLNSKTDAELKELRETGLKLLYIGIESGDDELLKLINKGETYSSTVQGLVRAQQAGLELSVMILTGLGGKKYSEQHAINSAKILNEIQPKFASTLVLSFPFGVRHFRQKFGGEFVELSQLELLQEMQLFLERTELKSTIFRSDHASNYLVLRGILSKDKSKMLVQIQAALKNPSLLRPEWQRGL